VSVYARISRLVAVLTVITLVGGVAGYAIEEILVSFDTPNGTRGARQPKAGLLMRWFNGWNMNRIRRKGGKIMGMDALILMTVGRKSGVERSSPVAYFPDGNDAWLIVASANGAAKNPAWYHNLAAHPDQVRVEMAGRKVPVTAEQLYGQAREQAWRRIKNEFPRFAKYEQQTDRELPVIRLRARSPSGT
jgi:deazaflavin-dependent oxidoreductase (nitroreductase family)